MNKKKVLVTGGAGFIGSSLIKKIISDNTFVYCIDNLSTGNLNNIKSISDNENFEFIHHDIINKLPPLEVDTIFNLACPASPIHYQIDPVHTMKTSVIGIYQIIDLALRNNAKIIFTSTSEIYGNPLEHPQKESYLGNVNTVGPRSCYDEGKRCSETILYDHMKSQKLDVSIMRIFNTYGPYMAVDDGRVISNFIVNALKNNNLCINGDGRQTRSFCYLDDTINALLKLSNTNEFGPINIGNVNETSILEVARMIIELTGSNSKITFNQMPQDDPIRRKPDITKAKKILDWSPTISLEDGLILTIDYFKKI